MRVLLDPGHGGNDPGARGHGIEEKSLVFSLCWGWYWMFQDVDAFRLHVSRASDENLTLEAAGRTAEAVEADFVVCVHANAAEDSDVRGLMTFYPDGDAAGQSAAFRMLQNAPPTLKSSRIRTAISVRVNDTGWNRVANVLEPFRRRGIPAVLLEVGFLTNRHDAAMLLNYSTRIQLATTLSQGILAARNEVED